ncbi:MAG: HEAT repeat domain-containing protein [Treponema sp.]|jgi:HEAT repeat protein|nr:HEAT repeat domain-containing protein [Treponema sp.]
MREAQQTAGSVIFRRRPRRNPAPPVFFLCLSAFYLLALCLLAPPLPAEDSAEPDVAETDSGRLNTIRYGTETEIAALIQSLRNEKTDTLDDALTGLAQNTHNRGILQGIFSFFAERGKSGLEDRAIRAVEERDLENNETVITALDYLGRLKAGSAVESLQKLISTKERRFMVPAIRALGRVAGADRETADQAAEYLSDYYSTGEPPDEYRREIITALGETGSTRGIPFLKGIASNIEERATLRMAALDALSKIGDDEALPVIISAVSDDDPNVRSSAIAALGPFTGEEVNRAILEAFRDSYYRVRLGAAQASRRGKLEAAVPYLKFRAERDDVPQVRDEAIRALGEIESPGTYEILRALFEDRHSPAPVRIRSAEMLVMRDTGACVEKLIAELDDAKSRNQTALYNGFLSIIGGARSDKLEALARRLLGSADILEKSYALDMAANNNFRGMTEDIRSLTENRNAGLARKARTILGKLEEGADPGSSAPGNQPSPPQTE